MSDLLQRAREEGTPLAEGNRMTFLWQGAQAPILVGDFNRWLLNDPAIVFESVGPELWATTVTIPANAYIEYRFLDGEQRVLDPLNRFPVEDAGEYPKSSFWVPPGRITELATVDPTVLHGTVTQVLMRQVRQLIGQERMLHLYQPPTTVPVPLLVVFDGESFASSLPTIVDNLLAQRRIAPIALAMIESSPTGRFVEYNCSDATVGLVTNTLLKTARAQLNLLDPEEPPGCYGIMGASMGGLMSLYTAFRAPEIFGNVLSQSGAFGANSDTYHFSDRSILPDLVQYIPHRTLRLWMDVGLHEWLLENNREMVQFLQKHDYQPQYEEQPGGHNYPSWRNSLWRGLEWLFPPSSGGANG